MKKIHSAVLPMGRPPKAAPVFLIILYHKYLWISLMYSLYIPYMFPRYFPYMFPCVFLNLFSQHKTSPYRKTTFIMFFKILRLLILMSNLIVSIKTHILKQNRTFGRLGVDLGPSSSQAVNSLTA